jgi:hypothetical protein
VERLFRDMAAQGVTLSDCMELYDAEVHAALQLAVASLDEQSTMEVKRCCSEGSASAVERLSSLLDGSRDIPAGSPVGSGHAGTALVSPAGAEDEEHRVGARRERLHHKLSSGLDNCSLDRLVVDLTLAERWADVNRLTELRDETVSHDWLWVVGTSEGGGMCDAEFLVAAARAPTTPPSLWRASAADVPCYSPTAHTPCAALLVRASRATTTRAMNCSTLFVSQMPPLSPRFSV